MSLGPFSSPSHSPSRSPQYSSAYSDEYESHEDGRFYRYKCRALSASHVESGYWLFAREGQGTDDLAAFLQGFGTPEQILLTQDRGEKLPRPVCNVRLRWVFGCQDTYQEDTDHHRPREGTAKQHLEEIYIERKLLGLSPSFGGETPVYSVDGGGRLLGYRQRRDSKQPAMAPPPVRHTDSAPQGDPITTGTGAASLASTGVQKARRKSSPTTPQSQTPPKDMYWQHYAPVDQSTANQIGVSQSTLYHWRSKAPAAVVSALSTSVTNAGQLRASANAPSTPGNTVQQNLTAQLPHSPYSTAMSSSGSPTPSSTSYVSPYESIQSQSPSSSVSSQHQYTSRTSSASPSVSTPSMETQSTRPSLPTSESAFARAGQKQSTEPRELSENSLKEQSSGNYGAEKDLKRSLTPSPEPEDDCPVAPTYDFDVLPTPPPSQIVEGAVLTPVKPALQRKKADFGGTAPYSPIASHNPSPTLSEEWRSYSVDAKDIKYDLADSTDPANALLFAPIPCVDCGETQGHKNDCRIAAIKPLDRPNALQLRQIAEAVHRFDPEQWRTHHPPIPPSPDLESPSTKIAGMAEIVRNEDSYKNDPDLHGLSDGPMLMLWAMKTSPNIKCEVIRHDEPGDAAA
ncbi:hypothetical protein BDV95DRAFT_579861 [Massariosphaeria phaeospora]|uniref:Uncharacterized protein n=1 Tax=Massariosphaeria phaeospora TaxID=100035 RepID=A0A7C8MFX8_9PLEO|nr:hypothetical protein BDV95DRAFT_579861 [Massariosphaeria phaeospora]